MSSASAPMDDSVSTEIPGRDIVAENFGLLIAYVLPGLVGLWAATYHAPDLKTWLTGAISKDSTIGGVVFLLLAALGVGMVLQVFRWGVFEQALRLLPLESRKRIGMWRPSLNEKMRRDPRIQAELATIRDQHYRYYQFNGALFVALPMLMLSWYLKDYTPGDFGYDHPWICWTTAFVLWVLLFFSTCDCYRRDCSKTEALLGTKE